MNYSLFFMHYLFNKRVIINPKRDFFTCLCAHMATRFALKFVSERVGLKNHVVGVKNQGLGVYERGGMDDQDKPCMHIYMWACISHKPLVCTGK